MADYPIVAERFHPPATALMEAIAIGTPLILHAEPENPYDPNAVAIWLESKDIGDAAKVKLEDSLPRYGYTVEQVVEGGPWHLGYIPRELAKVMREQNTVVVDSPTLGTFTLSPMGKPRVRITDG